MNVASSEYFRHFLLFMSEISSAYMPSGELPEPVCQGGEFSFAVVGLEHGHIYGQCRGLIGAGARLVGVYDQDVKKVKAFQSAFPEVLVAESFDAILDDPDIHLIAAAGVPNERGPLGCEVMRRGKDYFVDKAPFNLLTNLSRLVRSLLKPVKNTCTTASAFTRNVLCTLPN